MLVFGRVRIGAYVRNSCVQLTHFFFYFVWSLFGRLGERHRFFCVYLHRLGALPSCWNVYFTIVCKPMRRCEMRRRRRQRRHSHHEYQNIQEFKCAAVDYYSWTWFVCVCAMSVVVQFRLLVHSFVLPLFYSSVDVSTTTIFFCMWHACHEIWHIHCLVCCSVPHHNRRSACANQCKQLALNTLCRR